MFISLGTLYGSFIFSIAIGFSLVIYSNKLTLKLPKVETFLEFGFYAYTTIAMSIFGFF